MMRRCDGTDVNLVAEDGHSPCACGRTFDDVHRMVIFPHSRVGGLGLGEILAMRTQAGVDRRTGAGVE